MFSPAQTPLPRHPKAEPIRSVHLGPGLVLLRPPAGPGRISGEMHMSNTSGVPLETGLRFNYSRCWVTYAFFFFFKLIPFSVFSLCSISVSEHMPSPALFIYKPGIKISP